MNWEHWSDCKTLRRSTIVYHWAFRSAFVAGSEMRFSHESDMKIYKVVTFWLISSLPADMNSSSNVILHREIFLLHSDVADIVANTKELHCAVEIDPCVIIVRVCGTVRPCGVSWKTRYTNFQLYSNSYGPISYSFLCHWSTETPPSQNHDEVLSRRGLHCWKDEKLLKSQSSWGSKPRQTWNCGRFKVII